MDSIETEVFIWILGLVLLLLVVVLVLDYVDRHSRKQRD